jgi:hypothetical protein
MNILGDTFRKSGNASGAASTASNRSPLETQTTDAVRADL